jgi:hypothetical protein
VAGARRAAPGGRPGRRRGKAEEPTAAEVAEAEESAGIPDETAAAVAAAEAEELGDAIPGADQEAADELAEAEAETPAGQVVEAEDEAGIVDETGPAVAEAQAAETEASSGDQPDQEKGKDK